MNPHWKQTLLLAVLSLLVATPKLLQQGKNIVTLTYDMGSYRLLQGTDPYRTPEGGHDFFKYSPTFATLYAPFQKLPDTLGVFLWAFLNAFVFWYGIGLFYSLSRSSPRWLWAGFILCSMEISAPMLYQQVNPLLTGLMLIGFFLFVTGKLGWGGAVLAFATNLKVLPAVVLGTLSVPPKKRYLWGVLFGGIVTFAIPLLVVSPGDWFQVHQSWFRLLVSDVRGPGILDIESVLSRENYPALGSYLRYAILAMSAILLTLHPARNGIWLSLALTTILLVNHRTESPTFVFLAPAYLFLLDAAHQKVFAQRKKILSFLVFTGAFLVTISYNDLWPRWILNPHPHTNASKMWGTLLLWVACLSVLLPLPRWRSVQMSPAEQAGG